MHRDAGEQRPRLGGRKVPGDGGSGANTAQREARRNERVRRHGSHRRQDRVDDHLLVAHDRPEKPAVSRRVPTEGCSRLVHGGPRRDGAVASERMGERKLGLEQSHTAGGEVETTEERRRHRERMGGGADVVQEPRKGQLLGAAASAGGRSTLQHDDPETCGRKDDRPRETVRSRTDDQGVGLVAHACDDWVAFFGRLRSGPVTVCPTLRTAELYQTLRHFAHCRCESTHTIDCSTTGFSSPRWWPSAVIVSTQNCASFRCPPRPSAAS